MLEGLYEAERRRLAAFADRNDGDYAHPVFGEGSESPLIMLIGEAPGREEAKASHPFVGKAGKQLDELLAIARLEREQIFVTNAVKFRPIKAGRDANRTPTRAEVKAALPLLAREIELIRPRVIATLGNTPLNAVLKQYRELSTVIGTAHGIPRQLLPKQPGQAPVLFPLYHPASGIYSAGLIPVMEKDIAVLGEFVRSMGMLNTKESEAAL